MSEKKRRKGEEELKQKEKKEKRGVCGDSSIPLFPFPQANPPPFSSALFKRGGRVGSRSPKTGTYPEFGVGWGVGSAKKRKTIKAEVNFPLRAGWGAIENWRRKRIGR